MCFVACADGQVVLITRGRRGGAKHAFICCTDVSACVCISRRRRRCFGFTCVVMVAVTSCCSEEPTRRLAAACNDFKSDAPATYKRAIAESTR